MSIEQRQHDPEENTSVRMLLVPHNEALLDAWVAADYVTMYSSEPPVLMEVISDRKNTARHDAAVDAYTLWRTSQGSPMLVLGPVEEQVREKSQARREAQHCVEQGGYIISVEVFAKDAARRHTALRVFQNEYEWQRQRTAREAQAELDYERFAKNVDGLRSAGDVSIVK